MWARERWCGTDFQFQVAFIVLQVILSILKPILRREAKHLFPFECTEKLWRDPEWAIVLVLSCNQKQQLELEQLHSDFQRLRTQERHKSRQLEELTWVCFTVSGPAFKHFTIWRPEGKLPLLIYFFSDICLGFFLCFQLWLSSYLQYAPLSVE